MPLLATPEAAPSLRCGLRTAPLAKTLPSLDLPELILRADGVNLHGHGRVIAILLTLLAHRRGDDCLEAYKVDLLPIFTQHRTSLCCSYPEKHCPTLLKSGGGGPSQQPFDHRAGQAIY